MTPYRLRIARATAAMLLLCSTTALASERATSPPAPPAVDVLTLVRDLADPSFEGRGVGTAGLDSAAAYIAKAMARLGLDPAGDAGGWYQPFEITTGVEVSEPSALQIENLRHGVGPHYQPLGFSTNGTLQAPVVFAGYGITAPGYDYDDYAGIDARDRIVLVLSGEPGEMDSTSRFDGDVNTPHAELRTKAIVAREHGALGMLVVDGPRYRQGEPLRKPRSEGTGYMSSGLLAAAISQAAATRLFLGSGVSLAAAQMAIDMQTKPYSLALTESATVTVNLKRTRAMIRNVVGRIPGRDTTRVIVIGAHYDHLGYGDHSSLDPDAKQPHVGADDNASGVAGMLRIAGHFAARARAGDPPRHTLVFAAFTGEESGLLGSDHFVSSTMKPSETIRAMLNLDMVGRMRDSALVVMGAGTAAEFDSLLNAANAVGLRLRLSSDGYGPSDHSSFYKRDVPVLAFFTGAHTDYHKPSDTWDKVNASGLEAIARYGASVVAALDEAPALTFRKAAAEPSAGRIRGGGGYGAYLGTIPDYVQTEGGVLLSGVREGGPAWEGGLRGGDTIVRFDGIAIANIYDYTYALRSRKPGQQVRVTVLREGNELELSVTLGRRGSS